MAKHTYKIDLSVKSINKLIDDLNHYKEVTLPNKLQTFVEKLAERGIKVAEYNVYSDFKDDIAFTYVPDDETSGRMVGFSTPIHRKWFKRNGEVSGEYDIDPIAMAEFGAGWFASTNPWENIPSTRGSLGENGNKLEWFWLDENGKLHSSEEDHTINPTRPMYKAFLEMVRVYKEVAEEVFRDE